MLRHYRGSAILRKYPSDTSGLWDGCCDPSDSKSAEISRRHPVLDRVSKALVTVAIVTGIGAVSLPGQTPEGQAAQAGQPAPGQKNWKDRAEYDLYNAIAKEQDPAKRIALLNSWKEKYPTSDYALQRQDIYCQTYAAMNQPAKVIEAGKEALQIDPKDLTVLFLMAQNVLGLTKPTPDDLAAGEKAANGLLSNLDSFFDASKKPPTTSDTDWTKAKNQTETLAHTALGWIALQKKDNETAEKEFTKSLQLTPNNAQVSYWLGTAIIQEKKPEKQPAALFHFARAASLDQAHGGFPAAAKQSIETYFVNAYNRFHGQDAAELSKLLDLAKASPFPPDGFTIKDVNEVKAANEEKVRKENPGLALWMTLKQALTAADGQQYFDANMKDAEVPGGARGA